MTDKDRYKLKDYMTKDCIGCTVRETCKARCSHIKLLIRRGRLKPKQAKKQRPPQSYLQRLAGKKNWLQGFTCKRVVIPHSNLHHSNATINAICRANIALATARDCIEQDYQRAKSDYLSKQKEDK